jgi:hypothetical protein
VTPEFSEAVGHVVHDAHLDAGAGADLIAVGIERADCLEFACDMLEGERLTPELVAILVQFAVAIGVWIERGRWQS